MLKNYRILTFLATTLILTVVGSGQTLAAAKPTLASDGPKVRLQVGKNTVRSSIYNEQKSLPSPLKHRTKLPVYLIVTNHKGKESKYKALTRNSRFIGGNPPEKVQVEWKNVVIPKGGKYILTVEIPRSKNPSIYNLSRRAGSVSKTFNVKGGGNGKQPPQTAAGYDLIVKLKQGRGTRGAGYWVYLKTPEGRQIDKKRSGGNAQVTFKRVAPLKKPYYIEVKAGNRVVAKENYRMPNKDALLSIDLN